MHIFTSRLILVIHDHRKNQYPTAKRYASDGFVLKLRTMNHHSIQLRIFLLARKYPTQLINEAIGRARSTDRSKLLFPDPKPIQDDVLTAVTTY